MGNGHGPALDGRPCLKWTDVDLQDHLREDHNLCRNPDGGGAVWCYTALRTIGGISRWSYCDIPLCGAGQSRPVEGGCPHLPRHHGHGARRCPRHHLQPDQRGDHSGGDAPRPPGDRLRLAADHLEGRDVEGKWSGERGRCFRLFPPGLCRWHQLHSPESKEGGVAWSSPGRSASYVWNLCSDCGPAGPKNCLEHQTPAGFNMFGAVYRPAGQPGLLFKVRSHTPC